MQGADGPDTAEGAEIAEIPKPIAEGAESAEAAERKLFREPPAEINRLTQAVIAAAISVHRELGPGFLENVYETALAMELTMRGIPFQQQVMIPVLYQGRIIGESKLDLLVADELVVELKAVDEFRQIHRQQLTSYLRAGAFEVGLLINFNVSRLVDGVRRVVSTL